MTRLIVTFLYRASGQNPAEFTGIPTVTCCSSSQSQGHIKHPLDVFMPSFLFLNPSLIMVLKMGFSFVTVREPRGNPFYLFNCNFRVDLKGSGENISEMLSSVSLGNTLPFPSRCGGVLSLEFNRSTESSLSMCLFYPCL